MTTTVDDVDDATLIERHLAGDPHAFNEIIRRHRDRMWCLALRITRNPEDASDVVQHACLLAFRNASGFRGEARVTTWLHRIVVNSCLDHIRRERVRYTVPLEYEPVRINREFSRAEASIVVREGLALLPEDQRTAIHMVDILGMSVAEVAARAGVAEGTIKSRCSRGRTELARLIGAARP